MRRTALSLKPWMGFLWIMVLTSAFANVSLADTAREIEAGVDSALERFAKEMKQTDELMNAAKGVLVIPNVIQAGFGIGGEFGEGALRVDGETVDYYRLVSASFGFQLGAQKKDIIMLFMQEQALDKFRNSSGWTAGADGSVVLVNMGAEGSVDLAKLKKEPILGFVVGQKGLMYNLSLEGSKFTKIKK